MNLLTVTVSDDDAGWSRLRSIKGFLAICNDDDSVPSKWCLFPF